MKNSVWIGVSLSLLSAVATAAENNATVGEVLINKKGQFFSRDVQLQQLQDGSLIMTNSDGGQMVLPKKTLDQIRQLKLKDQPTFPMGKPCVAGGV